MPRSPTMTILASPNFSRTTSTIVGERTGIAGVAEEHPDRDRAPGRVGEQPVLDLRPCPSWRPGSSRGRPAGSTGPPAMRWTGRRAPSAPGWPAGQVAAGQRGLDRVLPAAQPVHRGVNVIGGRLGDPQVAQRGVVPPGQGGQLGARLDDPGDDQRQGQVPRSARRAQQRGQAQRGGHHGDGGDVAVRQRPGDGDRLARRGPAAGPSARRRSGRSRGPAARTGWPRSRS